MERMHNFAQWLFQGFRRRFWIGVHANGWFYVSVIVLAHILLEGTIASVQGLVVIFIAAVVGSVIGALTARMEEKDNHDTDSKQF